MGVGIDRHITNPYHAFSSHAHGETFMEDLALGNLLDTYGQNNRFKLFPYYTVCYGIYPSALKLVMPMDETKSAVNSILGKLDLEHFAFKPVFKNWYTDDAKDSKIEDDYAYEYVFRSETKQLLIHFQSQHKMVQIQFLYNLTDIEAEQWILETNHQLRSEYGHQKMPSFKVLIAGDGGFYTDDISTVDFQSVDITELYNEDFIEIDNLISESLQKTQSGMVLLHGEPGTGKTTYIKHLICKFIDKEFIFIQNDFVKDLLKPSFVSFLLQNKNAILIIEDAEKVVISRENSMNDSVVSTILQLTDGLFSDFLNIKIICTFNTNIERIDKALLRKGRMIAKYKFLPLSPEKTAALAKKLGHADVTGSLTLADIFGLDKRSFDQTSRKTVGFPQT